MVQGAEGLKGGYCQPAVREAWARMVQEKGSEVGRLKIHWKKQTRNGNGLHKENKERVWF